MVLGRIFYCFLLKRATVIAWGNAMASGKGKTVFPLESNPHGYEFFVMISG